MNENRATYSPEDNKLRLYPACRLDPAEYSRVKACGFSWAPKQELFVAPMWTPEREDLLIEFCGEVGDEDTSLVERAEARAERFEDYSDKRADDARAAKETVSAIADNIPLGQPILVGHHSERHARKNAERIENGMRKAVKMWETSKYWEQRAAGAIRAAKYKEQPEVRARRIKKIEADKRKQERNKAAAERCLRFWQGKFTITNKETGEKKPFAICEENKEKICRALGNDSELSHLPIVQSPHIHMYSARDVLQPDGERWKDCPAMTVAQCQEKAFSYYPGMIAHYDRWIQHYTNRLAYEKAMLDEQGASDLLKPEPRAKQLPLCNYRQAVITCENIYCHGETIAYPQIEMTAAEWAQIPNDYKGTRVCENSHRIRTCMRAHALHSVFITDTKVHEKPAAQPKPDYPDHLKVPSVYAPPQKTEEEKEFEALGEAAKSGVQVVSAPQLFPTPPHIARQMAKIADIWCVQRVLEPSAGTGNLIEWFSGTTIKPIVAIEINPQLAKALADRWPGHDVRCADFLQCNGDLGKFDRIIMNPPFQNGSDIKHIKHALTFLNPGGRLVAICANGPRQREALEPLCDEWHDLEPGTFKEQGTNVNTALLVFNA